MSESIWLSSGSKVEILFKFILMHLNSIVAVGISVFEGLRICDGFLIRQLSAALMSDFLFGSKKVPHNNVPHQLAQADESSENR